MKYVTSKCRDQTWVWGD